VKISSLFEELSRILQRGRKAALCTLISKRGYGPREVGAKMLVDEEGRTLGTIGGSEMERIIIYEALKALREGRPRSVSFALGIEPREGMIPLKSECGGTVEVFIDVIQPDPRLIIIGSGHIAKPPRRPRPHGGIRSRHRRRRPNSHQGEIPLRRDTFRALRGGA